MFGSYGDREYAFVIAPNCRAAGLEARDTSSFATSIEPDFGRWEPTVTESRPLTPDAYLAALLPRLVPVWRDHPNAGAAARWWSSATVRSLRPSIRSWMPP